MFDPQVDLAVMVRFERHEFSVRRDLRAPFGPVPIGEAGELRVGERTLLNDRRPPGLPHGDSREEGREREPRQPRRAGLCASRRRHRRVGNTWRRIVGRVHLEPDVTDVSQALFRILCQAAAQQPPNACGSRCGQHGPVRLALEDFRDRVRSGLACKRGAPGQHLEEHTAECPDIRTLVDVVTASLLGTHIGGGAEDRSGPRLTQIGTRTVGICHLRQAEVEHLHDAVRRDLDIRGLQVTVDDPFFVCGLECVDDLPRDRERFGHRQAGWVRAGGARGGCDSLGERRAFDQFQYETTHAVRLFDAVDGADVRVIQRGEHSRLALEPGVPFRLRRECRRQEFDRHLALKRVVMRAVDLAHPTNAEQGADRVRPEARANERGSWLLETGRSRQRRCRHPHERFGAGFLCDQRLDLAQQYFITLADLYEKRPTFVGRACERCVTKILNLPPTVRWHRAYHLAVRVAATASPFSSRVLPYLVRRATPPRSLRA